LLLDEPTSNLDQNTAELVVKEIEAAHKRGAIIVVASHDVTRLCGVAQEAIVLAHQNIVCHERLGPGGASIEAVPLYHKVNA
jgi:cell division transport system ATP-binding protein